MPARSPFQIALSSFLTGAGNVVGEIPENVRRRDQFEINVAQRNQNISREEERFAQTFELSQERNEISRMNQEISGILRGFQQFRLGTQDKANLIKQKKEGIKAKATEEKNAASRQSARRLGQEIFGDAQLGEDMFNTKTLGTAVTQFTQGAFKTAKAEKPRDFLGEFAKEFGGLQDRFEGRRTDFAKTQAGLALEPFTEQGPDPTNVFNARLGTQVARAMQQTPGAFAGQTLEQAGDSLTSGAARIASGITGKEFAVSPRTGGPARNTGSKGGAGVGSQSGQSLYQDSLRRALGGRKATREQMNNFFQSNPEALKFEQQLRGEFQQ